ncbi:inorganic pyrophosphatase [Dictyobacter aurantiacus]|uniref:Inorganic pyrophosphatase n=1 Tax=Dictyobacter aurantiacus TaxID=1936993 RepID=A0A401ZHC8_9CHLR|nr:inorganic pyrophosphatase [Dictyobacter aurantiacus]GCE06246.1 hypothetical protein KDAU_35750 [Dictyobacter aurantiacus]
MYDEAFWQLLTTLVGSSTINIDRPRGTAHPRYPDVIYPLDYGYLSGTTSGDGDGIDAWLGSQPERRINAILITVDLTKRDSEIKLLIGCTSQEQQTILAFHNRSANQSAILVERPARI